MTGWPIDADTRACLEARLADCRAHHPGWDMHLTERGTAWATDGVITKRAPDPWQLDTVLDFYWFVTHPKVVIA